MYCPNCAAPTSSGQNFCRACGFHLSQIVSAASNSSSPSGVDASAYLTERGRMRRWGFITFWGGIVLAALISIVGGAIENLNRPMGNFLQDVAPIGGLLCVVGLGMMIYSLFLPKEPQQCRPTLAVALPRSASTMPVSLEQRPEAAPSVTEHTTELLENGQSHAAQSMPARQPKSVKSS
ncbi:MAG: zinc ribbon domain-containing protein [Acidobacteriota bacterium]|nr:zinc ribbon domain-containing protein [Blastocatellia bacterium]MDW8240142.1 zinc ribbon domain-containing protein [Acidobacteriota bacterium]